MEIELKYKLLPSDGGKILADKAVTKYSTDGIRTTYLNATYYDTLDGTLAKTKSALRLRYEAERPADTEGVPDDYVCCFKCRDSRDGATFSREEYECKAPDIYQGIEGLLSLGAPRDLLEPIMSMELVTVAEVLCVRKSMTLSLSDGTKAELCIDTGTFPSGNGREESFAELELELKSGNKDSLCEFGKYLADKYGLSPEPQTKLARAFKVRTAQKV